MSMVCPQCKQAHDQLLECPKCRVRLLYQASALETTPVPRDDPDADGQWQKTPWGKMLVGLLLAQGLYYGLQNLTLAGLALGGSDTSPNTVWRTLGGLIVSHTLQAFSLIVGGALSGAGQRHGAWYGCFLGLANGAITVILQRHDLEATAPLQVFLGALPLLHMILGALGGLLGGVIWPPVPEIPLLDTNTPPPPAATSAPLFSLQLLSGPLHVWRVCAGIVVVVVGFGWSSSLLQSMVDLSGGTLSVTSHLQAKLVGWEIAGLATLIGAGFAGANTFNGLKHGLFTGLGAGLIFASIQMANPKAVVETVVLTVLAMVILAVAGGWFGGQLFPPVLRRRRRYSSYA